MKFTFLLAAGVVAALAGSAQGRAVSYTTSGGVHSENFDTLPMTGSAIVGSWVNDTTLANWHAYRIGGTQGAGPVDRIDAGTGSSNAGQLYSFGSSSASTERALGSVSSNTAGGFRYALLLYNNTGLVLTSFMLTYDGEQWRDGGLTAAPVLHRLDFQFRTSAVLPGEPILNDGSGYTDVNALDFTGPVSANATTTGNALSGNAAANRVAAISAMVATTWNPGEYLILRWEDANNANNDHGLAIDNLEFKAVPAPGAAVMLGLGGMLLLRRRR